MCETKLDKSVKSSEFLPVNYTTCSRNDRTSHGGGVLIALKSHYVAEEVDVVDIVYEIVCAKIVLRNSSPNYVGSFYHHPSDPKSSLEALEVALIDISDICKNNTKTAVVIASDFNAGDINLDSYSVRETSTKNPGKKKSVKRSSIFLITEAWPSSKIHQPGSRPFWTSSPVINPVWWNRLRTSLVCPMTMTVWQ